MYLFLTIAIFISNVSKVYTGINSGNLRFNQLTFLNFVCLHMNRKSVVQKQKQTVKSIARTQKVIICKEIIVP